MGVASPLSPQGAGAIDSMGADQFLKGNGREEGKSVMDCFLGNYYSSPERDKCYLLLADHICKYPDSVTRDFGSFCPNATSMGVGEVYFDVLNPTFSPPHIVLVLIPQKNRLPRAQQVRLPALLRKSLVLQTPSPPPPPPSLQASS